MHRSRRAAAGAACALTLLTTLAVPATASGSHAVRHVLLVSVDGFHASDLRQCVSSGGCPNLAQLTSEGTTYSRASTSEPSDSSPGLMALVTGASPKSTGVYYDDTYDRTMYAPAAQTPTGTQDCSGPPGAETQYAENIDTGAPSTANGQVGSRTVLGESIDPTQLPYAWQHGACAPVMPNDFLRTNSIFSVAHAAGLRTAWADKHPAADQQVSGHGTPDAVDDKFMTEINADVVPATLTDTRGNTVAFPHPNPTGDPNGFFITDFVGNTEAYDQIKVDAVLNEIDGRTSDGTTQVGAPAIFGMNFQSVSVGQKLVDPILSCTRNPSSTCDPSYVPGGYEPGSLAFTPQLAGAIAFVDGAIGSMVDELRSTGLMASTEIVITAKHGQSPIDPSQLAKIGHAEDAVLANAGVNVAQTTDDDVALLWLADQGQTQQAVNALEADRAGPDTARVDFVLAGPTLARRFDSPLQDPRTPDLIVQPVPGTIYSTSGAKVAEHGGLSSDDTHVALIVVDGSSVRHRGATVDEPVRTAQVAPTILAALGLDPHRLDGVRLEHTPVLPPS